MKKASFLKFGYKMNPSETTPEKPIETRETCVKILLFFQNDRKTWFGGTFETLQLQF